MSSADRSIPLVTGEKNVPKLDSLNIQIQRIWLALQALEGRTGPINPLDNIESDLNVLAAPIVGSWTNNTVSGVGTDYAWDQELLGNPDYFVVSTDDVGITVLKDGVYTLYLTAMVKLDVGGTSQVVVYRKRLQVETTVATLNAVGTASGQTVSTLVLPLALKDGDQFRVNFSAGMNLLDGSFFSLVRLN